MQTPGIPDLLAFVDIPVSISMRLYNTESARHIAPHTRSVQLWIEVKRPGGTLAGAQKAFRLRALEAGCCHVTGGVDEVLDWLKARGAVKYGPIRAVMLTSAEGVNDNNCV